MGVLTLGGLRARAAVAAALASLVMGVPLAHAIDPPASPAELEAFLDGVLAAQMAAGDVVGATVAVVKDGRMWMAKGYGASDLVRRTAVDADGTLFRIGSVSKVFVWIAALQQWQAGRLALDRDVNGYLRDLEIPQTFPQPVTLLHLMSHTPGFEDRLIGLFARGPRTMGGFHRRLAEMQPERLWPPGQFAAYSNWGTALAAHLVEIASGMEWDAYVEANLLAPLAMRSSTSRQPVPAPLNDAVSRGHRFEDGRWVDVPFEYVALPPAGSISATATDMARLMRELLADGDSLVLSRAAREKLFEQSFESDPRLNGMLHGLYERNSHGRRIAGHDGDTIAFHSVLLLVPEENLGLFASYNSDRGAEARDELVRAFKDRWFASPAPAAPIASDKPEAVPDLSGYAGFYRSLRMPENGVAKLFGLLTTIPVRATGDGELVVRTAEGARRFARIGDDLFGEIGGTERVAFRGSGALKTHMMLDAAPMLTFERADGPRNPLWNAALLVTAYGVFVLAIVTWPGATLRRRRTRVPVRGETRATLVALLQMLALFGLGAAIASPDTESGVYLYEVPTRFELALWLPVLAALLLIVQLVFVSRAWVLRFWWPWRRVHYTLTALAGIAIVGWCVYWNLVPEDIPPWAAERVPFLARDAA